MGKDLRLEAAGLLDKWGQLQNLPGDSQAVLLRLWCGFSLVCSTFLNTHAGSEWFQEPRKQLGFPFRSTPYLPDSSASDSSCCSGPPPPVPHLNRARPPTGPSRVPHLVLREMTPTSEGSSRQRCPRPGGEACVFDLRSSHLKKKPNVEVGYGPINVFIFQ